MSQVLQQLRASGTIDAKALESVQSHALNNDMVFIPCGPDRNVIRFIPPLVTTMKELDWALDLIDEGLNEWESSKG